MTSTASPPSPAVVPPSPAASPPSAETLPGKPPAETAPSGITGITPDEIHLVRKRQKWRANVLRISVDTLEHLSPGDLGFSAETDDTLSSALKRFTAISDHVRQDMQRLLESEMLVPQLDSQRHAANYFLDTIIGYVRTRAEAHNQKHDKKIEAPLESLSTKQFEEHVREALKLSADSVAVFLNNLISLEQFDLEVRNQRKRLQYLLGCDRNLGDLAESNSEIIDASVEKFESIVEQFFLTCHSMREDLGPLLETTSPYHKLNHELINAKAQLRQLEEDTLKPLEELRTEVEAADSVFQPLQRDLAGLLDRSREIGRFRVMEEKADTIKIVPMVRLKSLLAHFKGALQAVCYDRLSEVHSFSAGNSRPSTEGELKRVCHELELLGEELATATPNLIERCLTSLKQVEIVNRPIDTEEFRSCLADLGRWIEALEDQRLESALEAVVELRQKNVLHLKERICQEMGLIRTTFLQPCFAHIAADDPRSLHTPQYFYFKEFAEEAKHSQQLLERIHRLWQYIEELQTTKIQGLRFTPNNLNKIAQRVLLERRAVPSGPGWKELERFLYCLKGELVDKLEAACALPGVRFDDRDELSAFADRVTEDCAMLLAKRETAYKLMKEVERMGMEEGQEATHERYRAVILRVTCQDMAEKLRSLSQTLLEMIPYVGAMVGGIRMRTSLTFLEDGRD